MSATLEEITGFLDTYLRIREIPDEADALNGLQLDAGAGAPVERLAVAVDADAWTVEEACRQGAQLLLVHHGLFWSGNRTITGAYARKLRRCFAGGLSVYAAHAPLDVHPEVGNNAGIVRALGLVADGTFGRYHGLEVGLTAPCDLDADELRARIAQAVGPVRHLGRGPARVRRVAVVSGGAGSLTASAAASGMDAYLTGEGAHHTALEAEERGLHLFLAGHYRTEVFGVQALGRVLADRFTLATTFLEHDTGL